MGSCLRFGAKRSWKATGVYRGDTRANDVREVGGLTKRPRDENRAC